MEFYSVLEWNDSHGRINDIRQFNGKRAIDHDSERREHATYRICTPFHAFVLARSNDHHRCELMNSRNVRLPRIYLFILRSALNGHPIIPAETMASPFHGCAYYAYADVIWWNTGTSSYLYYIIDTRVVQPTRLLNIHAAGRDVVNERKMMMYTVTGLR